MPLAQEDYTDQGDNALFRLIKAQSWSEADALLGTDKGQQMQMAGATDAFNNTTLHSALGYQAPDSLLLSLLNVFPSAAKVHGTGDDWLPLHVAAMWGCSATVMAALIKANPKGLDDPGNTGIKGRTPRHFSQRFPHNRPLLERSTEEWIALVESERATSANVKDT